MLTSVPPRWAGSGRRAGPLARGDSAPGGGRLGVAAVGTTLPRVQLSRPPHCANPDCPDIGDDLRSQWVQIEQLHLAGPRVGEGPLQRPFAAVTCSKRCAVAVLTAAIEAEQPAEDAARERLDRMFGRTTGAE